MERLPVNKDNNSLKKSIGIFILELVSLTGTLGGLGLIIKAPFAINSEGGIMDQQTAAGMVLLGSFGIIIGIALEKKVKTLKNSI